MQTTASAPFDKSILVDDGAVRGTVIPGLARYSGRLGIEMGGQMTAALHVTDGRVELSAATDQPLDAVIVLRTEPMGRIELLDVPGCRGHMDAFGRARSAEA